jgi:hypothetical protein
MRCVVCHRSLKKAAFSMPSKDGLIAWGPRCGKGLVMSKPLAAKEASMKAARYRDGLTMDLFEGVAA